MARELASDMMALIEHALGHEELDAIAREVTDRWASGQLTDTTADSLFARIAGKRARPAGPKPARPSIPAPVEKRPSRLARSRRLASEGWMPSAIAANFTLGQQAVLAVIAQEIMRHGVCDLPINEIARRCGRSRTMVQDARRKAVGLRLIKSVERRLSGRKSDTNLITITDPNWKKWLAKRRQARAAGSRKLNTNHNK